MLSLIGAFRTLNRWQVMVLIAALFGAAAATYGVYANVSSDDQAELAENQQLIPVQLGNLVTQVSTSGNLDFPERESLTFGSQGSIAELLVKEGQLVTKDQVLAMLDRIAVATIKESIAHASWICRRLKQPETI